MTHGTISYCYNIGDIIGGENLDTTIGGVAGQNNLGKIEGCYNIGNITVTGEIPEQRRGLGGITGKLAEGSSVLDCKSKCEINRTEDCKASVGGVVGLFYQGGTISNCEWYSEGLEYGIGSENSNENATKNASIVMPSINSVINQE